MSQPSMAELRRMIAERAENLERRVLMRELEAIKLAELEEEERMMDTKHKVANTKKRLAEKSMAQLEDPPPPAPKSKLKIVQPPKPKSKFKITYPDDWNPDEFYLKIKESKRKDIKDPNGPDILREIQYTANRYALTPDHVKEIARQIMDLTNQNRNLSSRAIQLIFEADLNENSHAPIVLQDVKGEFTLQTVLRRLNDLYQNKVASESSGVWLLVSVQMAGDL